LDLLANIDRTRRKPEPVTDPMFGARSGANLVELAHQKYHGHGHEQVQHTPKSQG
jgi:hypothetical protein